MKKKLLLGVGLLFLCVKSYGLTLSEAETEVRRLIKDTATSTTLQRYPNVVLDSFINQAQREVITQTWCLQNSTAIALSAGTTFYPLPSDLIAVKLVSFVDSSRRVRLLNETSYKALNEQNPDYQRQTGQPMQYIVRNTTYTLVSASTTTLEISFIPVGTTSSTGTATIDYYQQPAVMTTASDLLLGGDANLFLYHESVVYQVVSKIKMIEGDTAGAGAYLQLYASSLQMMNSRMGEKPNLNPGLSGASSASSPSGSFR